MFHLTIRCYSSTPIYSAHDFSTSLFFSFTPNQARWAVGWTHAVSRVQRVGPSSDNCQGPNQRWHLCQASTPQAANKQQLGTHITSQCFQDKFGPVLFVGPTFWTNSTDSESGLDALNLEKKVRMVRKVMYEGIPPPRSKNLDNWYWYLLIIGKSMKI